jgi:hypothetical protein
VTSKCEDAEDELNRVHRNYSADPNTARESVSRISEPCLYFNGNAAIVLGCDRKKRIIVGDGASPCCIWVSASCAGGIFAKR